MMNRHSVCMLGAGLIADFYTRALNGARSGDRVEVVFSRTEQSARSFAERHGIPVWTTDLRDAIETDRSDVVVIGLPNDLHEECVRIASSAGKAILCTKPLGRTAQEAHRMLEMVEKAGVFSGYLEDLCFTPKTVKALSSVRAGAVGEVVWARSRETHPGPHSEWFWNPERAGGGSLVDLGCHCIEIVRNFIGKEIFPPQSCAGPTRSYIQSTPTTTQLPS